MPPVASVVVGAEGPRLRRLRRALVDSSFVRAVGATLATRGVTIVAGLLTSVLVARALGPSGRGLFAVAAALTAIGVQFGNLGLHASNTYAAARDRAVVPSLVGNSLVVSGALGAAHALAIAVTGQVAPGLVPVRGVALLLATVAIPVGLASLLLQNLLLGVQDVAAFNRVEILARGAVLLLSGAAILLGAVSVEAMLAASLVAVALSAVFALGRLRRHAPQRPTPSVPLLRAHLRYGIRAYAAALVSFLVLRVDLLMVQHYRGAEEAGYYSIAVALADMLYLAPSLIGTILFPRLASVVDDGVRRRLALRALGGVAAVMVPLVLVSMLAAPLLVAVLFGEEYLPVVPAFLWLAPGILLLAVHTIAMNYCAAIGMPPITVYLPLAALGLNVVLNAALLPVLGIRGASLASVLAYGVMAATGVTYVFVRRGARAAA